MRVSCIIPAYNEASTIKNVLRNVKKVQTISEIIVVDDGSHDNTSRYAKEEGVRVIRHQKNKGKGAALKTGIAHANGEILLFLDADLYFMPPKKITAILQPLQNDEADFVKTSFSRSRGRVTELVVKPLFNVIFPFVNFNQPLSGQFAMRRDIIGMLKFDDKWGVDIQILLQLVKRGVRIQEVDIGRLTHKKQPLENLTIMSEQVIKTMLSELGIIANNHKLILFDFDKTLIKESSIEVIASELGFEKELHKLRNDHKKGKIKDYHITLALAKLLKGHVQDDFKKLYNKISINKNAIKVIDRLHKRQYVVGIVSHAFSPVVNYFAEKMGISTQNVICPILAINSKGEYTGEVIARTKHNAKCCDKIICKAEAAKELMQKHKVKAEECVAVGDGKSDECLFRACGLALAYKPKSPAGDIKITNLSEILIYAD